MKRAWQGRARQSPCHQPRGEFGRRRQRAHGKAGSAGRRPRGLRRRPCTGRRGRNRRPRRRAAAPGTQSTCSRRRRRHRSRRRRRRLWRERLVRVIIPNRQFRGRGAAGLCGRQDGAFPCIQNCQKFQVLERDLYRLHLLHPRIRLSCIEMEIFVLVK